MERVSCRNPKSPASVEEDGDDNQAEEISIPAIVLSGFLLHEARFDTNRSNDEEDNSQHHKKTSDQEEPIPVWIRDWPTTTFIHTKDAHSQKTKILTKFEWFTTLSLQLNRMPLR